MIESGRQRRKDWKVEQEEKQQRRIERMEGCMNERKGESEGKDNMK